MDSVIQKKYFIGKSKPGTWSSVYTYKPSSLSIREKRGEIFASICLEGPKDYGLPTVGNMLLDKFHESYFENANDTCLIALEKAAVDLGKYLQKFLENDSAGEAGIDLNFISMIVFGDLIYTVGIGNGTLMIFRNDRLTDISDTLRDPTMEGLVKEASFVTKANDVYFIGTPQIRTEIMSNEFEDVAMSFNEQSLKNRLYKDESQIAFMMVGINIDRKLKELSEKVTRKEIYPNENRIILKGSTPLVEKEKEVIPVEEVEEVVEESGDETLADLIADEGITQTEENVGKNFGQKMNIFSEDEIPTEEIEDEVLPQDEESQKKYPKENEMLEEETTEYVDEAVEEDFIEEEPVLEVPMPRVQAPIKNVSVTEKAKGTVMSFASGVTSKLKNIFKGKKQEGPTQNIYKKEVEEIEQVPTYEEEALRPAATTAQRIAQQDLKTYQVVLLKIRDAIIRFFKGIKRLVWNNWLGFNNDDIYLKSAAARQRKWGLLIVLVLVVASLLYFSIQGLVASQNQKKLEDTAKVHLDSAKQIINEVNTQATILAKASGNTERKAAEITKLIKAQTELDLADTVEKYKEEVTSQELIIQSIKDKFDRIIPIKDDGFLVDFAGKFPNANITDMVVTGGQIFVIDAKYNKLYSVDYSGKITEVVSGLNNPRSITVDSNGNLIILDSDPDKAIAIVNPNDKSVTRMAASSNSQLKGVSQIEFYTLSSKDSRIYLLDNLNKSIEYYSKTGGSYGTLVKRNTMDELATAKDIEVVDDRLYFLMQKNLGLFRDYNKKEDTINVTGLKTGDNLLSSSALYIDGSYVYVADPSGKRVLVFTKGTPEIPLIAQYVYKGTDKSAFTDIKEIFADRDREKIFVLSNSKIIVLNLNSIKDFML